MNSLAHRQWTGRSRHQAGAALRLCTALWLVFYIVYTPIHLYRVPHSDGADCATSAVPGGGLEFAADESHDGHGNHERHPAAQHKFKVTQSTRAVLVDMLPVQAVEWVDVEKDCPLPQVFVFSGLSPPELPGCWQFIFRTALPVRAPSLLS